LAAQVDTVETLAAHPEEIQYAAKQLAGRFIPYFEVPLSIDLSELIRTISESGARAKVRTGGITPESIPDSHSIARFIVGCASKSLAFKATAGLHHPVRGLHRLTPNESSSRAPMHGFLNVFLAAALAEAGAGLSEIVELLDEDSSAAIAFDGDQIRWRTHSLNSELLAHSRKTLAVSFGSCSFEEPLEDLKALSLL
jgi:hypothetical protein